MKKNYVECLVKISEIQLDQENPRFPPVDNQREAIRVMLKDQGIKIVNLASDIYRNGLNPSSKLILFKDGDRLIDGDGNRRVTALKILETPSLSDFEPKIRNKINAILKNKGTIPSEVDCVIFNSREDAKHWISINHSGPQEGKGHISWDSEQKDRFEGNFTIGLQALDLLIHEGLISPDDKSRINKTTLDRLLSYRDVKSILSIKKNGNNYLFEKKTDLKKIVLELKGEKVDAVYTAEKGIKFVKRVLNKSTFGYNNEMADPQTEQKRDNKTDNQRDNVNSGSDKTNQSSQRTRRKSTSRQVVFGGVLSLRPGHINNLYRDIEQIYNLYEDKKIDFSDDFIVIFRMSLRMLAEAAAREINKDLNKYLEDYFDQAKQSLDQNKKTLLSNQNVEKRKVVQLFHTGAHDYATSKNKEQAIALSIILGEILKITYGRQS